MKLHWKALFCGLLIATFARADGLKLFPLWEQKKCPTEIYACYTFEQAKEILKIDLNLQLRLAQCDACDADRAALQLAVQKLEESSTLLEDSVKVLDTRLREKQVAVEKLAATVSKLEHRDVFGSAFPWVITTIVGIAAVSFVAGWYVGSH